MRVYQQRSSQPMKWALAFILFCVVMGWTFADVYGMNYGQQTQPCNPPTEQHANPPQPPDGNGGHTPDSTPSTVPEPSTLALFAMGLGSVIMYQRHKK